MAARRHRQDRRRRAEDAAYGKGARSSSPKGVPVAVARDVANPAGRTPAPSSYPPRSLQSATPPETPRPPARRARRQPPAVNLDDRSADRQAHAHAVRLGRIERVEDAVEVSGIDPGAAVFHRDQQPGIRPRPSFTRSTRARSTTALMASTAFITRLAMTCWQLDAIDRIGASSPRQLGAHRKCPAPRHFASHQFEPPRARARSHRAEPSPGRPS